MSSVVDGKNFAQRLRDYRAAFALKGGGPKADGTYVIEFKTAAGEERMPYGLFVPDVP
jgi:hypothetical protein